MSWVAGAYFGRRTLYLAGTITNAVFALILGIVASVGHSTGASYAQAVLGILISFMMGFILGPVSYTIIAETSSVRLRALSTGVGRAAYYVAEIPTIFREYVPL
jgi:SP family general alpha glucoside:H+ symporter-like MFS transporter